MERVYNNALTWFEERIREDISIDDNDNVRKDENGDGGGGLAGTVKVFDVIIIDAINPNDVGLDNDDKDKDRTYPPPPPTPPPSFRICIIP